MRFLVNRREHDRHQVADREGGEHEDAGGHHGPIRVGRSGPAGALVRRFDLRAPMGVLYRVPIAF